MDGRSGARKFKNSIIFELFRPLHELVWMVTQNWRNSVEFSKIWINVISCWNLKELRWMVHIEPISSLIRFNSCNDCRSMSTLFVFQYKKGDQKPIIVTFSQLVKFSTIEITFFQLLYTQFQHIKANPCALFIHCVRREWVSTTSNFNSNCQCIIKNWFVVFPYSLLY